MKIRSIPDQEPEEQIHGFQVLTSRYAIDIYISLRDWRLYFRYDKDFKDLAIAVGFLMVGFTNLSTLSVSYPPMGIKPGGSND